MHWTYHDFLFFRKISFPNSHWFQWDFQGIFTLFIYEAIAKKFARKHIDILVSMEREGFLLLFAIIKFGGHRAIFWTKRNNPQYSADFSEKCCLKNDLISIWSKVMPLNFEINKGMYGAFNFLYNCEWNTLVTHHK